ncbi:hypothetical protein [Actinomadura fibrosa]|uniref:Uncharacterized protein n=1 Tax=Actinomadura fibrosa TaxID=111802 RepID=A0ABW2Y6N9_9ACTN|nr:hypothetical protein [Actinomadura fibrosa]
MRNISISDQSWTASESMENQESAEVQELDGSADAEFERSLSFSYARI